MPVTAKDIAYELGLSQSTVSRILNGDARQRISPVTRERVLEAAQRREYQPNALARSLRRGRTNIVGLYTNHRYDARNDFLAEILGGLQHGCAHLNLDLLLHIGFQGRSAEEAYNEIRDGRIDGLLLHNSPDDPLVARLSASTLPVVALADPLPGLPSVTCDDEDGIQQLLAYLWERSHRRFAFIAPAFQLASVERRRAAWGKWLHAQGVSPEEATVLRVPAEDASTALDTLLQRNLFPCAVSCWNDRTAYSLLRSCTARNVSVPTQIAVTGFDGFLDDKLPARLLTTVRCPWANVASRATELLVRRIGGEAIDEETCLPVTLLPGDTA